MFCGSVPRYGSADWRVEHGLLINRVCILGYTYFNYSQNLANHHKQMSYVYYVVESDGKISENKLLSKYKMLLKAK